MNWELGLIGAGLAAAIMLPILAVLLLPLFIYRIKDDRHD